MWPDVETLVGDALASLVGGVDHVGSVTPSDLYQKLPFIRVIRYGGDDDFVTDFASVDVDCFAKTRTQAFELAQQARQILLGLHTVNEIVVDRVRTRIAPTRRPWDDDQIRLYGATYQVTCRRLPVS